MWRWGYYVSHFLPRYRGTWVGQCFWCRRNMCPEDRARLDKEF